MTIPHESFDSIADLKQVCRVQKETSEKDETSLQATVSLVHEHRYAAPSESIVALQSEFTEEFSTMGSIHPSKEWRIRAADPSLPPLAELAVWPSLGILNGAWGVTAHAEEIIDLIAAVCSVVPSDPPYEAHLRLFELPNNSSQRISEEEAPKEIAFVLHRNQSSDREPLDLPTTEIKTFLSTTARRHRHVVALETAFGDVSLECKDVKDEYHLTITVPALLEGLDLLTLLTKHTTPSDSCRINFDRLMQAALEMVLNSNDK